MDPLILRFLGTPEVIYQDQALKFRSRKVLALLIYLVTEPGWHSREKLIALLWPDSDRERGGVSLRSTVSRLRRTLAVAGDHVLTEAGNIGFDFEKQLDLDLYRVETAVQPEASPEAWQSALAVARGEFLEGFSLPDASEFDDWAALQREAWHHRFETIFDRLSQQQLEWGEYVEAVETATQWVAWASLSEPAYQRLMTAYFLAGNRTTALLAFEKGQSVLSQELGVEPAPETVDLAERIRKVDFGLKSPPTNPKSEIGNPKLVELPLVGRVGEHSRLTSLYQRVSQGTTQVVIIIGEAGIGKTRLARAFVRWASLEMLGADVLQGRAFEVGGRLPYQPLVEGLRARLEMENAPEDLLADIWMAELSQLLPELRDRYPDLPPAMSGEPDFIRSRIFEAVARIIEALARRRPVVLFVDDIQWADEGTLDMLIYLSRRWTQDQTPVLLLLTARQEDLTSTISLRNWLDNLGRDVPLTRLRLAALTPEAVQQLVGILADRGIGDNLAGETVVPKFGTWLQAETGGVPFFMEAMLQMLIEQGVLTRQQQSGRSYFDVVSAWQHIQNEERLPIPPGVREVILNRLSHLTDPARALLLAGSVIGRECSFERLCQVSSVAEEEGLTALEELLNGRLLLEISQEARPYRFAHDNIRQVIYTEAGEARRRLTHRRALSVLQQADASAAELAYHAIAARQDDFAFRYSLAAGDDALAAHVVSEAITHYNHARGIAASTAIETDLLCQLYTCRGRALELNNQYDEALQNYQEMAELADERDDKVLKLASLTARCIVQATQTPLYNPSRAKELGEAAVKLAKELDDRASEARVLWGLLLVEVWGGGDKHKALGYGQRSLTLAREMGLKEQMGYTLTNLVNVYWLLDQLQAAKEANREARELWRELGNTPMLSDSYGMTSYGHWLVGEFEAGFAAGEESIRLSKEIGNLWNQASNLLVMGWMYTEQGELGIAFEYLEQGLQLGQEMESQPFVYGAYRGQAWANLLVGATAEAERLADEVLAGKGNFAAYFRIYYLSTIVRIKVRVGGLEEAQRVLDEAKEGLEVEEISAFDLGNYIAAEAELLLALGQPKAALEKVGYLIERLSRSGAQVFVPEAMWLKGRALLALNEGERAKEALMEAVAGAEAIKLRPVLWPTLWELSQLEAAVGNTEATQEYHKQAQEIVTYIADHTGSDEQRAIFLALPGVQRVITE